MDADFALEAYKAGFSSLEMARLDASRKLKHFVMVSTSGLPEDPAHPRVLYNPTYSIGRALPSVWSYPSCHCHHSRPSYLAYHFSQYAFSPIFLFAASLHVSLSLHAQVEEVPVPVFGESLFQGEFSRETFTGFNPNYQFTVGDQVRLQIWGAQEFNETITVDTQGNLFIPGVGPLMVQGMRNMDLIPALKRKVAEKFINNVEVYATLEGAQPVKVFVGGSVSFPGLYAGSSADSVLFFLDKAGGIDTERGSFIDIALKRGGEVIQKINLYDFLLKGDLALTQFADGDVIFVGRRKSSITIQGAVHNSYQFEFDGQFLTGADAVEFAHPHTNATNVSIRTDKQGERASFYLPVIDALERKLSPGDYLYFCSRCLTQDCGDSH